MPTSPTTTTTPAAPQPSRDEERVTIILPGGAIVICRPDQVGEVTRQATWQPLEIICNVVGEAHARPSVARSQRSRAAGCAADGLDEDE